MPPKKRKKIDFGVIGPIFAVILCRSHTLAGKSTTNSLNGSVKGFCPSVQFLLKINSWCHRFESFVCIVTHVVSATHWPPPDFYDPTFHPVHKLSTTTGLSMVLSKTSHAYSPCYRTKGAAPLVLSRIHRNPYWLKNHITVLWFWRPSPPIQCDWARKWIIGPY